MKGFRQLKAVAWEKVEDINDLLDGESRSRFLNTIVKEDGVSYDEAVRLCSENPKYSLGWKMCSPSIMTMLKMRGGSDKFKTWLTPEELEIYEKDVEPMNLKKMIKKEERKQKRSK